MSCNQSSSYNSWRWTSLSSQVYDTNEKNFLLVSRSRWSNPCNSKVKISCDALHWIQFRTTIKQIICHHVLKHTLIWTLIYYTNTIIKSYWIELEQDKCLTMMNMRKMKITTMGIVMIPMMMIINNSYFIFHIFWKTSVGTDIIACKTPTNLISSVSLPRHV